MAIELDILSPTDRPALLGVSAPDMQDYARGVLDQLGYKVHVAANAEEFLDRFGRVQYQLVLLDDNFGGETPALNTVQWMAMPLRRHATICVLGDSYQTLDPLQAFQQSVHAVINRVDADKLMLILQQVIGDNASFLSTYRDVQAQMAQGKR